MIVHVKIELEEGECLPIFLEDQPWDWSFKEPFAKFRRSLEDSGARVQTPVLVEKLDG